MKRRKIFMTLGSVFVVTTPIVTVISCSDSLPKTNFTWKFRGTTYSNPANIPHAIWGHNDPKKSGIKLKSGDVFGVAINATKKSFSYTLTANDAKKWNAIDADRITSNTSVHAFLTKFLNQIGTWSLTNKNGGKVYLQQYNAAVKKIVDGIPKLHS